MVAAAVAAERKKPSKGKPKDEDSDTELNEYIISVVKSGLANESDEADDNSKKSNPTLLSQIFKRRKK